MRQGSVAKEAADSGGGAEGELREGLQAYRESLENVAAFEYLGRVLMAGYDDWTAVVGKLSKARKSWGRLSRILIREGADPKVSGHFFKAVLQAVLLFGAETWVLTPRMERALDSFKHRVAQRLTRKQLRRRGMGVRPTRHWRRQWGKQASRVSGNPSRGGRTRSCSILRRDQFWTFVSSPLGTRERGCRGGDGNRPA